MAGKTLEAENVLMHSRKPDFSGWATKAGVLCADGRTIMKDAFKHQDKAQVPLVWQHTHDEPENVLGHAILEARDGDIYAYGYFNDTERAGIAKGIVQHGDINSLSIFANSLKETAKAVSHGVIRELSLVLAGANPGALIDNIELAHSATGAMERIDDEAVVYNNAEGIKIGDEVPTPQLKPDLVQHAATDKDKDTAASGGDTSMQSIYDAMSDQQKEVVHYMVGAAATRADGDKDTAQHSATAVDNKGDKDDMKRNVFDAQQGAGKGDDKHTLSHDGMKEILGYAEEHKSMKKGVEEYALKHGITNIELLFPEAKTLVNTPDWEKRRTEWVAGVLGGTRKSPFSRVKTMVADITQDEARAKGYIKGNYKEEEWFDLKTRETTPTTVYKKQQLDRDDIVDITDFDVVSWIKGEMRLMLEEEVARAILIGDGRAVDDKDKIKDPAGVASGKGVRSILKDNELFAATINIQVAEDGTDQGIQISDQVLQAMIWYKGTGTPTWYAPQPVITKALLARDAFGHRQYRTMADLAAEMGVSNIVPVEVMESVPNLFGIIVNLQDYVVGADRGGEVNLFEDFDIDYNQEKYLLETRFSGGLIKYRSALVLMQVPYTSTHVTPVSPQFNPSTGVITPATTSHVTYKRDDTKATVTTGSPITLAPGADLVIYAVPDNGYFFTDNVHDSWKFKRPNS